MSDENLALQHRDRTVAWKMRSAALTACAAAAILLILGDTSAQARKRGDDFPYVGSARKVFPQAMFGRHGRRTKVGRIDKEERRVHEIARKAVAPPPPKGPLLINISIAKQRLTLFDDGVPIAQSAVSTGTASHPTPLGVFSVIQKSRWHRSNIYSGAPMPFMQRITWSGVAMHLGQLPGYPASHGCIRLPEDFATRLWGTTKIGARVIITRDEIAPSDFAHAKLFVRRQKPVDAPAIMSVPAEQPKPAAEIPSRAGGITRSVTTPAAAAKPDGGNAEVALRDPLGAPPVVVDATAVSAGAAPAKVDAAAVPIKAEAARVSANDGEPMFTPTVRRIAPAPVMLAVNEAAPATAPATLGLRRIQSSLPAVEPGLDFPAPLLGPAVKPLRAGPVSVFVSRKERKLFVRKGFEPLFSMPVTIAQADQTIGTHVFTAMELKPDGEAMRWSVVSMPAEQPRPAKTSRNERRAELETKTGRKGKVVSDALDLPPPVTATEALNRIEMPKDAVERISDLLAVGASLVISDHGLGPETGEETDFIVVTR